MKQRILELIAQRPDIRSVEIEDELGVEPRRIKAIIQGEIDSGLIVLTPIRAPNLRLIDSYRVAGVVRGQEEVAAADAEEPAQGAPRAAPTVPPVERVKVADQSVSKPAVTVTKVDAAIAYLRTSGPVRTGALALAMCLGKGKHPSNYLAAALKDGRVTNHQGIWSAAPANAEGGLVTLPAISPSTKNEPAGSLAQEAATVPSAAVTKSIEFVSEDDFVAGLLSNGTLRLEADGQVMALASGRVTKLFVYLQKIGFIPEPA